MLFDPLSFSTLIVLAGFHWGIVPHLDRQSNGARTLVAAITAAIGLRYLAWRLTDTILPFDGEWWEMAWVWFIGIFEWLAFIEVATFLLIMSRANRESDIADRVQAELERSEHYPSVDVFIPTYNEPLEVLEKSIIGAKYIDYPNFQVHVLDDGRREWLREFCADKGVNYLTRADNSHAKAGNLNNGLGNTSGELVAIFDADFVASRHFLRRSVGFFADPTLGILQTPQHFFNKDPVQMNLLVANDWPDEQRLFFDDMAASRDAWGVSFCCGSCSLLRRAALEAIGGVPTASITEDLLTTLAMLRKGFRTRYLNEKLSQGLAPESLEGFFVQRARWCQGAIQTLFLPDGPLGKAGLTPLQRFLFLPTSWLIQYPARLMTLMVPMVYLLTGLVPLHFTSIEDLISFQLPMLIGYFWAMRWFVGQKYAPVLSSAIGTFATFRLLPTLVASLIKPFGKPFRVTPKGNLNSRVVDYVTLTAISVAVALTAIGLVINSIPAFQILDDQDFFPIAAAWGVLNIVTLSISALICFDVPRKRKEERFYLNEAANLTVDGKVFPGRLVDMSLTGAKLRLDAARLRKGETATLDFAPAGEIQAEIVATSGGTAALAFAAMSEPVRERLIATLFGGAYSTQPPQDPSRGRLVRNLMRRAFGEEAA